MPYNSMVNDEWWKTLLQIFKLGSMEDGSPIPVVLMANKVDRLSNGAETFESGAKLEKVCTSFERGIIAIQCFRWFFFIVKEKKHQGYEWDNTPVILIDYAN